MRVRVIANAQRFGGGEMSVLTICRMLTERGHETIFHPTGTLHDPMRKNLQAIPKLTIGPCFEDLSAGSAIAASCDVLFAYMNNFVYQVQERRRQWENLFRWAGRRVMCLNFCTEQAANTWFRKYWDLILFLNTTKRASFPDQSIPTACLAPCVDLEPFLKIEPDYSQLTFIRHARHIKHCGDETHLINRAQVEFPDARWRLMGVSEELQRAYDPDPRFELLPEFQIPVFAFLRRGNLFLYRLHPRMKDQGPRVVVEAMAAG
ncbi:MAG: glycosyltransferase family protein, partial [Planctomycetota bacterium]